MFRLYSFKGNDEPGDPEGKDGMQDLIYNREMGATAGCTVRLSDEW